ncbi:hypothetical protein AK830_g4253 [Neonectria ditissima]|uniref:Uncharacterized protein n=1 Tax=Neonectria ditissima TaxID=78410 RepID=A0A0P7B9B3_9HYPO|nr:hypothetical protein AK830_g4253 [Neonectria ditissima]
MSSSNGNPNTGSGGGAPNGGSGGSNPVGGKPTGQNGHGGTIQDIIIEENLANTKPI